MSTLMLPLHAADPIDDWAQTRALVRETTAAIDAAADTLAAVKTPGAQRVSARLSRIADKLRRPLRIAIAGEFNTGKSTLCNRLIGLDALPTSAVPTTNLVTKLYRSVRLEAFASGASGQRVAVHEGIAPHGDWNGIEVGIPAERLDGIELVDLPGLADPRFGRSVALVRDAHPLIVLWCSSCTQACKESERAQWSELPASLLARSLLVLSHADLVKSASDRSKLLTRVQGMVGGTFGGIVMASSKAGAGQGDRQSGGIDELWGQVCAQLDHVGRRRCSIASSLAHRILSRPDSASGSGNTSSDR